MEKEKIIRKLIKRVKMADVEPVEYLVLFFSLSLFLSTRTALLSLCQKSLGHTQELLGQHTHTAAILAAFYNTHKGPSESKAKPLHHKTVRY
jgi:hypothetical protein